ncbi:MAG: hemerythrin domain-containing protein [Nocardioides sp.]|nr:hemerythrin domain-containing protein [Nocardioides sp.]
MSDDTRAADPAEVWDETTRPTLAEPPDASYPPAQEAVAQHLVDVHDHLRSELGRLRGLVDQVRRGLVSASGARAEVHAMSLRQNNWTLGAYCQSYCGFVDGHHSLEDASVFPHLRRADPSFASVLDRLQVEHVSIHGLLDQVDTALVVLVREGDEGALDRLEEVLDLLSDRLLSHLAYEERELRGALARHGFS